MIFNSIMYMFFSMLICCFYSCQFSEDEGNRNTAAVEEVCPENNTKSNKQNNVFPDSVILSMERDTLYMPIRHVRFTIINETERNVKTDERYSVERFMDDRWIKCQRKYDTVINDIGIEIMPGGLYSFTLNLSNVKGGYVEGRYRVCKTIKIDNKSKLIDCEFYVK